jgi:transposase
MCPVPRCGSETMSAQNRLAAFNEAAAGDAVWQSFAAYLPERGETTHRLGCHRPSVSDRDCFEAILFRLVTGCSWDVAGRLGKGSETTGPAPTTLSAEWRRCRGTVRRSGRGRNRCARNPRRVWRCLRNGGSRCST